MAAPAAPPTYSEVTDAKAKANFDSRGGYPYPAAYAPAPAPYPGAAAAPYPNVTYAPPPQQAAYWQGPQPTNPQPYSDGAGTSNFNTAEAGAPAFNVNAFSDKVIRHAFIRKVYLILMVQLLVTSGFVAFFILHTPTRLWVQSHVWFYGLSYAIFFVTYIVLICFSNVRRKFPGNFIALAVFTLTFSYVAATVASYHTAEAVLIAAGITAAVTLAVSLFAMQTRIDFTLCSGLLFGLCMVLMFAGIAFIIVYCVVPMDMRTRYILQCTYGAIGALVMCMFLVFDTQMVVGGANRKMQLSPEEYITGALQLYLDIVYLFLCILGMGKK